MSVSGLVSDVENIVSEAEKVKGLVDLAGAVWQAIRPFKDWVLGGNSPTAPEVQALIDALGKLAAAIAGAADAPVLAAAIQAAGAALNGAVQFIAWVINELNGLGPANVGRQDPSAVFPQLLDAKG